MINPTTSPFNPNSVPNSPGSYSAWLNSRMNPSDPKSILTPQEAAPDLFKYGEMLGVYKPESSPKASEASRKSISSESIQPKPIQRNDLSQKSWNSSAQKSFSEAATTAGRDAAASVRSHLDRPNPFTINPASESANGMIQSQTISPEPGQNTASPFSVDDNSQNPLLQQNRPQPNKQASTGNSLSAQQAQNNALPSPVLRPTQEGQQQLGPDGRPVTPQGQQQPGPDGRPVLPQGQQQPGPDGKPVSPQGQQQPGPDGKPVPPQGQQQLGQDGKPVSPQGQQQPGPDGKLVSPQGQQQFGPSPKPLPPQGQQQTGSDGKPVSPQDQQQLGPDGLPLAPDGQKNGPNPKPQPTDGQEIGPDGKPASSEGQQIGPDGKPVPPKEQQQLGPDGKPIPKAPEKPDEAKKDDAAKKPDKDDKKSELDDKGTLSTDTIIDLNNQLNDSSVQRRKDASAEFVNVFQAHPEWADDPKINPIINAFLVKILQDPNELVRIGGELYLQTGIEKHATPKLLKALRQVSQNQDSLTDENDIAKSLMKSLSHSDGIISHS